MGERGHRTVFSAVKIRRLARGLEEGLVRQCPHCELAIRRTLSLLVWADDISDLTPDRIQALGLKRFDITELARPSFLSRGHYDVDLLMVCDGRLVFRISGTTVTEMQIFC